MLNWYQLDYQVCKLTSYMYRRFMLVPVNIIESLFSVDMSNLGELCGQ